jgi:hypothetical protein
MRLFLPLAVTLVTACPAKIPPDPPGECGGADPPASCFCTSSAACPAGHVCNQGYCALGTCDPRLEDACASDDVSAEVAPFCCRAWEDCPAVTFTCRSIDPAVGCGDNDDDGCVSCTSDNDCGGGGNNVCSAERCIALAGLVACNRTSECGDGERCEPNAFVCVPDRGGCEYCDDLPELCCEAGETCGADGFCVAS